MSKAFLRESDLPDLPEPPPARLPPGTRNYLTPAGAQRLRDELTLLLETQRPSLTAAGADHDAKQRLHLLDQRIRYLEQSLRSAEIIEPPVSSTNEVRIGARVTVRDANGEESTYRIVGVDEIDPEHGWVSWLSPIARALLSAKAGQRVLFKAPSGERELEVLDVAYD